jgi:hypothetical protein
MLVGVGAALGMAVAVPIAAQSRRQLKQAQKLLSQLELVDGVGSGLDADSLQGLTPAQVAALAPWSCPRRVDT